MSQLLVFSDEGQQGTVNLAGRRLARAAHHQVVEWNECPATCPRFAGYRFLAEIIGQAVWRHFRFPLSLRMVEEMLAFRGIVVSHETPRQWGRKFGQAFANGSRRRLPRAGDKCRLDEVVFKISGVTHWLWRAVDQTRMILDVLVWRRRDK